MASITTVEISELSATQASCWLIIDLSPYGDTYIAHISFIFPDELFLGLDVASEDVSSFVQRMTALAIFEHYEVSCG